MTQCQDGVTVRDTCFDIKRKFEEDIKQHYQISKVTHTVKPVLSGHSKRRAKMF